MATPVSKQVPDRFLPVMGRVRGAQRPLDPMARLDLVVSTPVRPYDETENLASAVAAAVFNTSQALAAAENVLERLAEAGWVVSAPVISDDGGFMDLIVSLRKRCASAQPFLTALPSEEERVLHAFVSARTLDVGGRISSQSTATEAVVVLAIRERVLAANFNANSFYRAHGLLYDQDEISSNRTVFRALQLLCAKEGLALHGTIRSALLVMSGADRPSSS